MNSSHSILSNTSSSSIKASSFYPRLHHVGEKVTSNASSFISTATRRTSTSSSSSSKKQFRTCSLTGAIIEYPSYKDYQKVPISCSSDGKSISNKISSKKDPQHVVTYAVEKAKAVKTAVATKSSLKPFRRFVARNSLDTLKTEDSFHTRTTVETDEFLDDSFRSISNDTPESLLQENKNEQGCLIEYSSGLLKDAEPSLSVSFGDVDIYEFPRVCGDNPAVSAGPPISIGKGHISKQEVSVDDYESIMRRRRPLTKEQLKLNAMDRMDLLRASGATLEEILAARDEAEHIRLRRVACIKALIQKKNLRKQKQLQEQQQQQQTRSWMEEEDGRKHSSMRKMSQQKVRPPKLVPRNNDRTGFAVHSLRRKYS